MVAQGEEGEAKQECKTSSSERHRNTLLGRIPVYTTPGGDFQTLLRQQVSGKILYLSVWSTPRYKYIQKKNNPKMTVKKLDAEWG